MILLYVHIADFNGIIFLFKFSTKKSFQHDFFNFWGGIAFMYTYYYFILFKAKIFPLFMRVLSIYFILKPR